MLPPPSPTPSGPSVSSLKDALLSSLSMLGGGGLVAALLHWFAARSSTPAQQQAALNDAFSGLTADLQEERAYLIARISELERDLGNERLAGYQKDGEIRGLKQSLYSLQAFVRRSGLESPGADDHDGT